MGEVLEDVSVAKGNCRKAVCATNPGLHLHKVPPFALEFANVCNGWGSGLNLPFLFQPSTVLD